MLFCARNKPVPRNLTSVKIDGIPIEKVNSTKFLGVMIDEKLSWSLHIDYIAGKVAKTIGVICKARKVFDRKVLRNLYFTFTYPYLIYCNSVWGLASVTHLKKLHILQKRIIRIICGAQRFSETAQLFHDLGILNIYDMNKIRLGIFSYKLCNSLLPAVFDSFHTPVSSIHDYDTRQSENLYPPGPRTEYRRNSVAYQSVLLWNSFSENIRSAETVNSFKTRLFRTLI